MEISFDDLPEEFAWADLYYLEYETNIGIAGFRILIKNQEVSLVKIKDEFETTIKNDNFLKDKGNIHIAGDYYNQFYDYKKRIISGLETNQRNYILLSMYAFWEGILTTLVNKLKEEFKNEPHLLKDKKLKNVSDYWDFLKEEFKMDVSKTEPLFNSIFKNREIRNAITHNNGKIAREKFKELKVLGLEIEYERINIGKTYIEYLLKDVDEFFNELFRGVDNRYKMFPEKEPKWIED